VALVNSTAGEVKPGEPINLAVSRLDLTSLGSPANKTLSAVFTDAAGVVTELGSVPVTAGSATVNLPVPSGAAAGAGSLVLTAAESGTTVTVDVKVAATEPAGPACTKPVKPARPADLAGQLNYGQSMAAYRACLRG
jgi:5'-nucleotidase